MWRRTPLKFSSKQQFTSDVSASLFYLQKRYWLWPSTGWVSVFLFSFFLLTLINDIEQPPFFFFCTTEILVLYVLLELLWPLWWMYWTKQGLKKACLLDRKFIFSVYIIGNPINFKLILNLQLNLFQRRINRKLLQNVNIS